MSAVRQQQSTGTQQRTITIRNPITGESVGTVPRHTADDVIAAVERARAAQKHWAETPFRDRAAIFKRFHDLILQDQDAIMDVIQAESGKSRRDAFVEIFALACAARYYAYHGWKHIRPRRIRGGIPLRARAKVVYRPVGVVGIIGPWNFPLLLTVDDAIPALLAGNGVVIKPASLTPLSAIWAREKLIECGLPEGLIQVVTGPGGEVGNALIDHVDYLMFTGSTEIGRKVAERAAGRLIRYSMELGGKNAMIVLADANIKHAAIAAAEGAFNNCGQVCINWERVYVEAKIYDQFVSELIEQTKKLRLGTGKEFDYDLGSLISREQLEKVEEHVRDAVEKGAKVLVGGRPRPELGPYFYEPTVLAGVTPDMLVHSEETFGPVLSVYKVESADEAIRLANDSRYGLNAAIFTRRRRYGERLATRVDAGTVSVNDTQLGWITLHGPMGGFKESGVGRRHGPEGIRKYTEPQTIATNLTNFQIGSFETALSINRRMIGFLTLLLKLWRRIPFLR